MNKWKKRKGNTLIELVMVMVLLILFGVTIYQLIQSGSQTQEKIIAHKTAEVDARIALSFVNVRLRQSDMMGKISVKKNDFDDKNAIVLKTREEDTAYDTWIYFRDGRLMECVVQPGDYPTEENSIVVATIDDFQVDYDAEKSLLTNKIIYKYDKENKKNSTLESVVHLRSNANE